jgi:hypothetical protein
MKRLTVVLEFAALDPAKRLYFAAMQNDIGQKPQQVAPGDK